MQSRQRPQILLLEGINHKFKRQVGTRLNSGLSVCLEQITSQLDDVKTVGYESLEHIKLAVAQYKPKHAFIQAIQVSGNSLRNLKNQFPETQFYCHIHSRIPFLVTENFAFSVLNSYWGNGLGVVFNNKDTYEFFKDKPNTYYLPNLYKIDFKTPIKKESETLDVGCFGSVRLMKNHCIQALASIKYAEEIGKKLRFHTNFRRTELGASAQKNLIEVFRAYPNHELVSVPWKTHGDFINYIQSMDISLQLSLSESFNIVAADTIQAGVPLVVGPEIDWVSPFSIANPSSLHSILERIRENINNLDIVADNRRLLEGYNEDAKQRWKDFTRA